MSLKDGYAVRAMDVRDASAQRPARLRLLGRATAGGGSDLTVDPGTTVQVTTGAPIPRGAEAVVADEFARQSDGWVLCHRDAGPRRNILERGGDVRQGEQIVGPGEILRPATTGLLAAAGISPVHVRPRPRVGLVAIGDEIVTPGEPLVQGRLYASNVVTLRTWLRRFHMEAEVAVIRDRTEAICEQVGSMLERLDVVLTSGGAWKSERDLTVGALQGMGGRLVFHRVRMGPGKAIALVQMQTGAVFCLPGGPPSNEMAFLQIVLPALLHLSGRPPAPFASAPAILTERVGGDKDWSQFFYAGLESDDGRRLARPLRNRSRLRSQAEASVLIPVPEGTESLEPGTSVQVQVLHESPSTAGG